MKVRTEAVQFKADQKLLDFIENKLGKLENYFDRIIDAKVILKLENSGQVKDKISEVKLNVPGISLFAKYSAKTFEEATDKATANLTRQLKKYKDKLQAKRG